VQVTIQSVGVDINSDLETKIQLELQFSLSHVEPHITLISITLNSATYIRDHNDIHCRITLDMVNQPNVVIKNTQVNLEYSRDRVLHKASRAVERLFLKA